MNVDTLKAVKDSVKLKQTEIAKIAEIDYKPFLNFLEVLIWPIVAIVAVLILRRPIINLINRMNKIGFAGVSAEASQQRQETVEKGLPDQEKKIDAKNDTVDKILGLFSNQTIERAVTVVNNESKVNEAQETEQKIEILHKYSQALYLILSFERIYNVIFGSQLFILDRVNTGSDETKDSLKTFYDSAVSRFPEFYATYQYDDYFNFLISNELLVKKEDETYNITWIGRDFLKFLVENGKSLGKKY